MYTTLITAAQLQELQQSGQATRVFDCRFDHSYFLTGALLLPLRQARAGLIGRRIDRPCLTTRIFYHPCF